MKLKLKHTAISKADRLLSPFAVFNHKKAYSFTEDPFTAAIKKTAKPKGTLNASYIAKE